ncbi:ABC transporter permease [uncultured Paludibaculum sp.]|uniref:ABC transporter permease n=1 Tax=uncultured Paludibaculum sp. TaxID=1765020 RepID=UPI002AAB7A91|nr:ABC transporter permease [uncultured Paludibaculum sp.]
MHSLGQDLRFSIRSLLKDRGFFLACVAALGLGIGSTTAIFSVVENVLLNPFPYTDSDRIYGFRIVERDNATAGGRNYFSVPEFRDYQQKNHIFTDSMGVWETTTLMGSGDDLVPLDTDTVTDNAFQFLGVAPLLGRGIVPGDAKPGAPLVFVLSHKVWLSRFGGDPHIVGQTFRLNDKPATLVGIMPRRFAFWGGEIWMPATVDPSEPGAAGRNFVLYGHLRPGLSVRAAEDELTGLATRLSPVYARSYPEHFLIRLEQLADIAVGRFRNALFTLVGAVGLLLLIGCANVANLLLARAAGRQKELALRMTLGAGRWRIVRQLMTESILLALAGAVAGCVFASVALKGLIALVPLYTFPDEALIAINRQVLLATAGVAIAAAFIFGLAPALLSSRGDLIEPLRGGARGNTGFRRSRLRNGLIAVEITLSMLLLTASGLLMRSFFLQRQVDNGIRTSHMLMTSLSLPAAQYRTTGLQARFTGELLRRLETLPGVVSDAAAVDAPPRGGPTTEFDIPGIAHSERWKGHFLPCTRQYFDTTGLRLLAGRLTTADDEQGKRKVALINQSMVRKYFGKQDPLGRHLVIQALRNAPEPIADPRFEVVGVVSDMKNQGVREEVAPQAFIPYTVQGYGTAVVLLHTAGEPTAQIRALTAEILKLDRNVVPQQTMTVEDALEITEYARPRFGLVLFSVFAGIGLLLMTVGVYSVVSWTVTQQRHEIGIRMALGASARDVHRMVLTDTLRLVLVGVAAGMALSWVVGRLLASQLWGVPGYDSITLCVVSGILIAVGLAAAYLPSVRATRVDPAVCLRWE